MSDAKIRAALIRGMLTPLSDAENERRKPTKPEYLVGALQNSVHQDTRRGRVAKSVKVFMVKETALVFSEQDGDVWTAYSPEFDVMSWGYSHAHAIEMVTEATMIIRQECVQAGDHRLRTSADEDIWKKLNQTDVKVEWITVSASSFNDNRETSTESHDLVVEYARVGDSHMIARQRESPWARMTVKVVPEHMKVLSNHRPDALDIRPGKSIRASIFTQRDESILFQHHLLLKWEFLRNTSNRRKTVP